MNGEATVAAAPRRCHLRRQLVDGRPVDGLDDEVALRLNLLADRVCLYLNDEAAAILSEARVGSGVGSHAVDEAGLGAYRLLECAIASGCYARIRKADRSIADLPGDAWPDPREWRLGRV